jgi:hypothetical protein
MTTRINKSYSWRPSKRLISRFQAGDKRAITRFCQLVSWLEGSKNQLSPQNTWNWDEQTACLDSLKESSELSPEKRQELLEDFFYAHRSADQLERCAWCNKLLSTKDELQKVEDDVEEDWFCDECAEGKEEELAYGRDCDAVAHSWFMGGVHRS